MVQVFSSSSTSSVGAEVAKLYITPNGSGVCHYDLSQIAEGYIEHPLSKGGTPVHAVQDAAKVFFCDEIALRKMTVRAGQYNGTTETLNEDSDYIYLIRGVEQTSSGLNPDFQAYYPINPTSKVWLTDRPQDSNGEINIEMAAEDEAVMMFMNTDNLDASGTIAKVRVEGFRVDGGADGTADITISASTDTWKNLLALPIGPAHWSHLGITSSAVTQVSFQVQTSAGNPRSEKLWVRHDCRPLKHDATQLAWINSRGGWDYLRFDSRAPKTISVSGKEYRKNVGSYGAATFSIASDVQEYDIYAKTGKESYTLSEQFFTAEERDLLQYLMRSPVVQMRVGNDVWEPAIVRTNSLQIQPNGSRFYAVSLNVELARDIRC